MRHHLISSFLLIELVVNQNFAKPLAKNNNISTLFSTYLLYITLVIKLKAQKT